MVDIELARNFGELFDILRKKGGVQGSKSKYEASFLIDLIDELITILEKERIIPLNQQGIQEFVKRNNHLFEKITRSEDLRRKVIQLSIKQALFMSKQSEQ